MSMRITPHRQYELGQARAQTHYAQGAKLQEQMSSGSRVNKPSDDPTAQKVILNQTAMLQQLTTQSDSVETVRHILSDAQTQIRDAQQLMVKAKSIALQARQSTDSSEQEVYVQQLNSLLTQLDDIANSKSNGQYLFGGTQTGTPPFSGITQGNAVYQASPEPAKISVPGHPDIKTYYSGIDVFQPPTGGELVISGSTGIASGTGTSSGSAPTTLTIRHTLTTFSGSSGIQTGTSSADQDTILGASGTHTLTIHDTSGDGSSGTISLNGGPAIPFTNSDDNLLITGPQGEQIYVNTQSMVAGFNGTIDIAASGTLSLDQGATQVPVDFSSSQLLTANNGSVVQFFDTTGLEGTGTVTVSPARTNDVFQTIQNLKDAILNPQGLSASDAEAAFDRSLQDLDGANDHLLSIIGEQSVDLEHLDTLQSRIEALQLNAQTLLGSVQATDYPAALTQLQEQQNLLQFTLQTISTMNSISILDFL